MLFGIDLGGTKIELLAMQPDGSEVLRHRIATPRGSYDGIVGAIVQLIQESERKLGESGSIGIGIPGTHVADTGLIKNANTTELNGRPLWQDLEQRLGRSVRISNDANCFALSEATDGAAAGEPVVFGVILGTGCGGGLVVHGRCIAGRNGIGGEWGHNPLPRPTAADLPAPPCFCGHVGCIETYCSGPAFARDYKAATGDDLKPAAIVAAAEAGNAAAKAAYDRFLERLAKSLALVINIVDPDCIVIGGGMSHLQRIYEEVPKLWLAHVFSDRVSTRLVQAKHGDSSGVRGAARLWS
ncbi:MAG: ROK family protein [Deltaproteobacteria bacterium]|nr:ROK family protein [Deltaproteobacteria bacterium]